MSAATDCTPHDPSGQDSLSLQIKQCAGNPAALTALLRQLCPGLTPAVALEWIRDSAFEAEAVRQAAELLNGEWSQES